MLPYGSEKAKKTKGTLVKLYCIHFRYLRLLNMRHNILIANLRTSRVGVLLHIDLVILDNVVNAALLHVDAFVSLILV